MSAANYIVPGRQSSLQRLRALGRLKSGQMNKTETAYERYLHARREAGEVLWYRFEGIKLRLADNTFLTVDFAVMAADGQLEMHDVKGGKAVFTDDARAKTKIAADQYPFQFRAVYPRPKREGGGWIIEDF